MLSTQLGSEKYKFLRHWFDLTRFRTRGFESHDLPKRDTGAQLIRPSRLVLSNLDPGALIKHVLLRTRNAKSTEKEHVTGEAYDETVHAKLKVNACH